MSRRRISATVLVSTWSPSKTLETRTRPKPRPKFQSRIRDWFQATERGTYTTQQLADYCHCKRQTASEWRRGRRPSPLFHGHIAAFFASREARSVEVIFGEIQDLWERR